mgnify:CR=1 FL=1
MRVLFISDADAYYGAPKAMLEMIISLKKLYNVEPVVFTSQKSVVNKFCEEHNIENYVTYHRGFLYDKGNLSFRYVTKNLLRFFRYKIDNIIALNLAEKYVDFNTIDLIHSNSDRNDLGIELSIKHNIPHILHIRECVRFHSFRNNFVDYLNRNAGACIAISECVKKDWIELGIKPDLLYTVYDGIDLDDIPVKDKYDNSVLKIVCVGSLNIAQKSQDRIIQAMDYLPENLKDSVRLDFIGEGEDEEFLKQMARHSTVKNINFLGYRKDVRELLKNYDIGIMSSGKEAFGRTTIEYGAAGLAVLATHCGANIELVNDGVTGILYDYDDSVDLAKKINMLYYDNELRRRLGIEARKKAIAYYSKELNASNVFELYQERLKKRESDAK